MASWGCKLFCGCSKKRGNESPGKPHSAAPGYGKGAARYPDWVQMRAGLGFGPFKMHPRTPKGQTVSAGHGTLNQSERWVRDCWSGEM